MRYSIVVPSPLLENLLHLPRMLRHAGLQVSLDHGRVTGDTGLKP